MMAASLFGGADRGGFVDLDTVELHSGVTLDQIDGVLRGDVTPGASVGTRNCLI